MTNSEVLFVERPQYLDVVSELKGRGYEMCADLTAVDYLIHAERKVPETVIPERYELVVNLLSLSLRSRVRIRVQIPEADPTIASLFGVYPGTDAMEREVYDLFGITFLGHPDLTRILLPQDWEGHPLRKDYAVGAIPVQFKAVNRAE